MGNFASHCCGKVEDDDESADLPPPYPGSDFSTGSVSTTGEGTSTAAVDIQEQGTWETIALY